jgi:RNA polymerase sigma-70 factor, ECF subfamily
MRAPSDRPDEDPLLRTLMREYQRGNIEAFDRLHDALAADLKRYLTALCLDPTRADDLVQETFLQIHRSRAVHTPGEPVRPWVFAIAKRVFLMYRRGATRLERLERRSWELTASASLAPADRLDAKRQVEAALQQVAPSGRLAFILHHLLGLSFTEVAARLGIKPGAAKLRSSRAAGVMRAWLRKTHDE